MNDLNDFVFGLGVGWLLCRFLTFSTIRPPALARPLTPNATTAPPARVSTAPAASATETTAIDAR